MNVKENNTKEEYFVLRLPLITEKWQDDELEKTFRVARKMYNILLNSSISNVKKMKKDKNYIRYINIAYIEKDKYSKKEIDKAKKGLKELIKKYELNEFDLINKNKNTRNFYKSHIDSSTGQAIAKRVYKAIESWLYGEGKKVHFKTSKDFNSIRGTTNKSGITYSNGFVKFGGNGRKHKGMSIPVKIKTQYERDCLEKCEVVYNTIIRETIKEKTRYFVNITLKGKKPDKYNLETGTIKGALGKGVVGIDIGVSSVAVSSESNLFIDDLFSGVEKREREIRTLQRKLDRSRRATNPDNYNSDGTCKNNKFMKWNYSNSYKKTLAKLKELYRKQIEQRKIYQNILANRIVECGDTFYIEKMNFEALKRRGKETKKSEKTGKYQSKKRFGSSINWFAPAGFITLLEQKIRNQGGQLIQVNTRKLKASQYNQEVDNYFKKTLNERWQTIYDKNVQRDLYSAFVIQHVNNDLETVNKKNMDKDFSNFVSMHDSALEYALKNTNLKKRGVI